MDRKNSIRIVLGAWMLICVCASARAQVFIAEGKVRRSVFPGENIAGKVTLHNTSDQEVSMRVYWEDFVYKPPFNGTKEFLRQGTTQHSLVSWVNVSSRALTFPPFATKTVPYTINVPADMDKGHYGVLFFEKKNPEVSMEKGLTVVSRVGCLFFVEPENKRKEAVLENFRFTEKQLMADFINQGNVILIPDGTYYIIDEEGMVFDRGQMAKVYVPPGKSAQYTMVFNADLSPGVYTLVMTIGLEEDDVLVKEIDFKKSYPSGFNIVEIRD
ncbi:MAG: hypothetical protein KAS66_14165 [Candidatus Omnitrophica bacterium]|nr:hypothetical protein [Candidatus Omnitrophota bacterium]